MKKGNKCLIALMFVSLLTLTGCDPIVPDSPEDGQYATQTPMSAVEYSIYVNKQVTVYTQQLTTRMTMARNAENAGYENELSQTKNSIEIMKDVLDEVTVTMPSNGRENDRKELIKAMKTAIGHMEDYQKAVEDGKSVSGFIGHFQNDFNALTGLANMYYE